MGITYVLPLRHWGWERNIDWRWSAWDSRHMAVKIGAAFRSLTSPVLSHSDKNGAMRNDLGAKDAFKTSRSQNIHDAGQTIHSGHRFQRPMTWMRN